MLGADISVDKVGFDAADVDRDIIADRLRESVAEEKGKVYRKLAAQYSFSTASTSRFRMNTAATTALAVCDPHIYTVTKDRHLIKWALPQYPPPPATSNFTPARRPKRLLFSRGGKKSDIKFQGHVDDILCVAASQDGKFVATGGKDSRLVIWDANTLEVLKVMNHHRAAVNGLVFRRGTNQLYSCSSDRTVKLWSLDELAYVETLFGHQDEVVGIAALNAERCVTVGARDRTARLWKIGDETQLVFRGRGGTGGESRKPKKDKNGAERYEEGSIDVVAMIDDEYFVTGSDNGYFIPLPHSFLNLVLTATQTATSASGPYTRRNPSTPSITPTALLHPPRQPNPPPKQYPTRTPHALRSPATSPRSPQSRTPTSLCPVLGTATYVFGSSQRIRRSSNEYARLAWQRMARKMSCVAS